MPGADEERCKGVGGCCSCVYSFRESGVQGPQLRVRKGKEVGGAALGITEREESTKSGLQGGR